MTERRRQPSPAELPSHRREMTATETRYLRSQRASLLKQPGRVLSRTLVANAAVCGGLMFLTWLVTDDVAPWLIVAIWSGLAAVLAGWTLLDHRLAQRRRHQRARLYDEVLAAGQCVDMPVKSTRMWEFEEIEDEGAAYAFELETGGVVFIAGQEFYADRRFPNSDFSLVGFSAADGSPVDSLVVKRGTKLAPERLVRASEHEMGALPDHLDFSEGTLEEVCATFIRR